jgi:hypothetical protein
LVRTTVNAACGVAGAVEGDVHVELGNTDLTGSLVQSVGGSVTLDRAHLQASSVVAGVVAGPFNANGGVLRLTAAMVGSSTSTITLTDVPLSALHVSNAEATGTVAFTGNQSDSEITGTAFMGSVAELVFAGGALLTAPALVGVDIVGCLTVTGVDTTVVIAGSVVGGSASCVRVVDFGRLDAVTVVSGGVAGALSIVTGGTLQGGDGVSGPVGTVHVDATATVELTGTFVAGDVTTLTLDPGSILTVGTGFAGTIPHFDLTNVTIVAAVEVVSGTTPTLRIRGGRLTSDGAVFTKSVANATVDQGAIVTAAYLVAGAATGVNITDSVVTVTVAVVGGNVTDFTVTESSVAGGQLVAEGVDVLRLVGSTVDGVRLARESRVTEIVQSTITLQEGTQADGATVRMVGSIYTASGVCLRLGAGGVLTVDDSDFACFTGVEGGAVQP